jgi:hypothetical protein
MTLNYDTSYQGSTTEWECPEGDVFITIAAENGNVWIDAKVGKAGTPINSDAFAISALVGTAIRNGIPVKKIVKILRGVSHEDSNHLLARSTRGALSLSDAIGKALAEHYGGELDAI